MITAPLATPKQEDRELNRRLKIMGWLCIGAFVVLAGRLWQLQVLQGEMYLRKSADNFVKDIEIPALRGQVRDHKGRVLADNRAAYNVYVTPRFLTPEAHERLREYLGLTVEQAAALKAKAAETRGLARYRAQLFVEDVSREQMALVATNRQNLPGVQIEAVPRRTYPLSVSGSHLLGYINEISAAELNSRRDQGYRSGDLIGRTGLERQWEGYLRGTPGFERVVVDAKGQRKSAEETRELLQTPRRQDPVPGNNIVLTIDADLQRLAERAFRRYPSGAAVVVDVESGRLLAIVSKPGFDPNLLSGRLTFQEEARLNADPSRPRLDKTLREHYYPGSTFKVVPAVAALEEGVITPEERVQCNGYHELGRRWFRCSKFHGRVNMYEALAQSCNVYFYKLGEHVGMDRIAKYAREFGLGEPTGLGLNGEVPGFIPTQAWYKEHAPGGFRLGYTLNTTIGQGSTKVTVLQLAMLYAAIANGGSLYLPQVVERIDTSAGAPVQEFPPRLRRRVAVKPQHLETLQRALAGTTHEKGTAYDARLRDIEVSGKTGTAQVRRMKARSDGREHDAGGDHAWFVGFAPTRRPEIAVVVLVEHGGLGGHVAAPVAMEIIRGYFEQVAPDKRGRRRAGDEPARGAASRPLSDLPAPQLKDLGPTPVRSGVGGGR